MRFDASMESLINTGRSESFVDLNETDLALSRSVLNQGRDMFLSFQGKQKKTTHSPSNDLVLPFIRMQPSPNH